MKLRFEKWLEEQNFSEGAYDVFEEAIKCYRATAYRSALLMSYVGFLTIVRDKLMETKYIPKGYTEYDWKINILAPIQDGENWERNTYDKIKRADRPVINTSKDLKTQIDYWKDRRNDCAHNKRNMITYSHVESFWAFLISNIEKITVLGSIEELIIDVETFFDISKTPANEPFDKLSEKILTTVTKKDEMMIFIPQMVHKMCTHDHANNLIWDFRNYGLLNELFLKSELFSKEFIKYLDENNLKHALVDFLKLYPVHANILRGNNRLIREIWYSLLFEYPEIMILSHNSISLYCSLLRNELIPKEQLEESFERIFSGLIDGAIGEKISEIDYTTLKEHGFFKIFDSIFTGEDKYNELCGETVNDFHWANRCSTIITKYLENAPISKERVNVLSWLFPYNGYWPRKLRFDANKMFEKHPDKMELIKNLIDEYDLNIPDLRFLRKD
ncbi:hypothetical protein HNP89_001467 [Methanococcus maripaludis]|uniref:Uncharacterized protein n=1 Tax=Methanococcus maripaludis TaxID=39152 RepID=A0A7J9P1S8_METMI|nr:hypothetical protein [Methanococcus maripaludis]MBA2853491.1 hypothetical protein [Methanococcus maripaludis]